MGASEARVALVDSFCELYESNDLFDGDYARPLHCDCPDAPQCWAGVPEDQYPAPEEAPVSVPWIGAHYRPGGVAALAINFNTYGGLGAQWWIRRGGIDRLRQGKRNTFEYRAGTYLQVTQASLAGEVLKQEPDPIQVAAAWDGTAFLEAIKCSPRSNAGAPTGAMESNCPPRFLAGEIPLLEPGVLLVIGRRVGEAVAELLQITRTEELPGLWRGHARIAGKQVAVVCCNHPSHGNWKSSVASLSSSLEQHPVVDTE